MTEKQFYRILKRSPVAPYLLPESNELRFKVGLVIGILNFHIPPDIRYQEHSRLLPLSFRPEEWTPEIRPIMELTNTILHPIHLKIAVWRNTGL